MNLSGVGGFDLNNLAAINVILGKNGCGKSFLLKAVEQALSGTQGIGNVRYVSPERGGTISYEAGVDQAMANNQNWIGDNRRKNQSENFRQQSASLFRQLELFSLRALERDHQKPGYISRTFDTTVDVINTLLDRVTIKRDPSKIFLIKDKETNGELTASNLSSGESELISLGIEFLSFVSEAKVGMENLLFVDEPDVHLHPDLQDRLARFIAEITKDKPVKIVLATHSTALLAGLSSNADVTVAFMKRGDRNLSFKIVSEIDKKILPMFGAHPLSNVFNESPILLIEGEDDERIWQQAVRSSKGVIRFYPCVVDGNANFSDFEAEVNNVIEAVYDKAKAYSLRDRDRQPEAINDVGHVKRMRLACRAAENLMLSNDVLISAGTSWEVLQDRIQTWLGANQTHQYYADLQKFVDDGLDRKGHDLKSIRNILIGLISNKPWEVLVGQAVATLANGQPANDAIPAGSLPEYLGEKLRALISGFAQQPQVA